MRPLAAALLALAATTVLAQAPQPYRLRGTVEKIEGTALTVKTYAGNTVHVTLSDNYAVMGIRKASASDIDTTKYIGTTTLGERDGAMVALEVHIFPEAMRGVGEGHRDWDLRPNSKMTNAAVANVVGMGKDRVMTVKYKDGEKKVLVTDATAVVSYAPAERSALKAGAAVFVIAEKRADGSVSAARVNVGLDGQAPPM